MSMKLNLGLLATKLSQADPEDTIPPVDCNAYLVDKIFLPLSRGETVSFQTIDYSQFDETDIGDLEEYNEYVVRLLGALEPVCIHISEPTRLRRISFGGGGV